MARGKIIWTGNWSGKCPWKFSLYKNVKNNYETKKKKAMGQLSKDDYPNNE